MPNTPAGAFRQLPHDPLPPADAMLLDDPGCVLPLPCGVLPLMQPLAQPVEPGACCLVACANCTGDLCCPQCLPVGH